MSAAAPPASAEHKVLGPLILTRPRHRPRVHDRMDDLARVLGGPLPWDLLRFYQTQDGMTVHASSRSEPGQRYGSPPCGVTYTEGLALGLDSWRKRTARSGASRIG